MEDNRVPVNSVMPESVRGLADKIAASYTKTSGIKYSRSDVIVIAIQQLAKKEKVA